MKKSRKLRHDERAIKNLRIRGSLIQLCPHGVVILGDGLPARRFSLHCAHQTVPQNPIPEIRTLSQTPVRAAKSQLLPETPQHSHPEIEPHPAISNRHSGRLETSVTLRKQTLGPHSNRHFFAGVRTSTSTKIGLSATRLSQVSRSTRRSGLDRVSEKS
jgi:hypothetical protein